MTEEIVVSPGFMAPVVSVQDALIAYQAKKELIEKIMRPGVDFGAVPGTSKETLLKAGAEKAASFFGLDPRFTDAEVVEDWTGQDHGGEAFFYYRRTCSLYRGERLVASVDGSCNSWEKKYRYRWVNEQDIPAHLDKSKLKMRGGKIVEPEFAIERGESTGKYGKPAEYWQKFRDAIEAGTAVRTERKKADGGKMPAWEIDAVLYCIPNDDVAEQVNTILKMADKRALVAAILIATGLSDYFTQDMEDFITPSEVIDGIVSEVKESAISPDQPAQSLQGVKKSAAIPRPASTLAEQHSALWKQAQSLKLLTPENVKVWAIGGGASDEEIGGKIALIQAAIEQNNSPQQ